MISTPELKHRGHGAPSAEPAGVKLAAALQARRYRRACARWTREALTAAAARLGFRPFGAVDGNVLPSSSSTCSIPASRRMCRCSPASTAARSAR